jgi:uncharacterized membrane protein
MAGHRVSVTVNAPIHQVYEMFTHFNDYPKFMRYVREVTYVDDQRSHWVVDMFGTHEWDAVNEDWVPDRQVGWRSVSGLRNSGRVSFTPISPQRTLVDVELAYDPPAGLLGDAGEALGAGDEFERHLLHDLQNFTFMVEGAPPDALDPSSSSYLFHAHSAAAEDRTTADQDQSMGIERRDEDAASSTRR